MPDMNGFPREQFSTDLPKTSRVQAATGMQWVDRTNKYLYTSVAPDFIVRIPYAEFGALELTYVSDGDTNGVFYYGGTRFGTLSWSNPSGVFSFFRNNNGLGSAADMVDRTTGDTYQSNVAGNYLAVDFGAGRSLLMNKYSLRNRGSDATRPVRNWKMQGTNVVTSFDDAGLTAATWTDLDTRVSDTTMAAVLSQWATYTPAVITTAYRYIRFLQTGNNGGGDLFNTLSEWELYGSFFS